MIKKYLVWKPFWLALSFGNWQLMKTEIGSVKMRERNMQKETLIEKIRTLPPERVLEVEDFVDFLRQRNEDRRLTQAAARLSENAFQKVWDNPEDDDYDRL